MHDGPTLTASSEEELPVDVTSLLRPLVRQLLHPDVGPGEHQARLIQLRPVLLSLPLGGPLEALLFQLGQHHDQGNLDSEFGNI